MNYNEASVKFHRLPQSDKMLYITLFKKGLTDLVTFMTEYEKKQETIRQAIRDRKTAIVKKEIEETASQHAKTKNELLDVINEQLINIGLNEAWWLRLRGFFETACGSKTTELVVVCLKRIDAYNWQVTTLDSPSKKKRVVIDVGAWEE